MLIMFPLPSLVGPIFMLRKPCQQPAAQTDSDDPVRQAPVIIVFGNLATSQSIEHIWLWLCVCVLE